MNIALSIDLRRTPGRRIYCCPEHGEFTQDSIPYHVQNDGSEAKCGAWLPPKFLTFCGRWCYAIDLGGGEVIDA